MLQITFSQHAEDTTVILADCTCPIGSSGACGHITGALYQIANYKQLGKKALPEDIASTSLPQTWHLPRGQKITGTAVQDMQVSSNSKAEVKETAPNVIKSNLYNPLRTDVDWHTKHDKVQNTAPELLILAAIKEKPTLTVPSKFGPVPFGSVLSYQQRLEDDYIMNMYDNAGFSTFACKDVVWNSLNIVLNMEQMTNLDGLVLTSDEVTKIEVQTRLQSKSPLWYRIRKHRVTASSIGDIYKRKGNEDTLVKRLKSTRHVTTAMRQGIALEPKAAKCYAEANRNNVNIYPCGVIVSLTAPWIAASPDRKVYNPERNQSFGLLEIKCPQVSSILECPYLIRDEEGQLKLKRNHNYYYQVLTQLAVSGLEWCDLFVWCSNDFHQETIYFNSDNWNEVKRKVDVFYFNHFM